MSRFPLAVEAGHQTGFDDLFHGQTRQLVRADGILKVGEAAFYKEGAFLPVVLEEVRDIQIEFVHSASRQKIRKSQEMSCPRWLRALGKASCMAKRMARRMAVKNNRGPVAQCAQGP